MVFKIDNSQIVINGKSILKALAAVCIIKKVCKAMRRPKPEYYVVINTELKKEQKVTKAKNKVESI